VGTLRAVIVDPAVERYAETHTTPDRPELLQVAEVTRAETTAPGMMVGQLEGQFLATLVHMLQPQRILEIGTFTGYSALAMAPALPPGGRIVTCEVSEHHAALAQRHFDASPFGDRIELRFGPAIDTLRLLGGPFDLVFIDADKTGYPAYYEATLPLLSDRGVIALDNMLWQGRVLDPKDDDTRALVAVADHIRNDSRVDCVLLTVRDGVMLVRKRTA
jgi:predicted O-methyltransferase YrrM